MAELKETDIKKIIQDEIRKFSSETLDREVGKAINDKNSKSRAELIKAIKDAFDTVYKTLWQKKDFWRNEIR
jgi:hypothetical protein